MDATFFTTALRLLLVLWLITFSFQLDTGSAQRWEQLSKEEKLELNRQLKLINKPAVKSFRTEYGDIIDCVDVYKQLALDHPLLKNHRIQMKPKSIPKGIKEEASKRAKCAKVVPENINCPQGSVPIKRATKEDLMMANHVKSLGFSYPTETDTIQLSSSNSIDPRGRHSAVLQYDYYKRKFGAKGRINVWQPSVRADQYSTGSMWIVNGPRKELNYIEAGWGVNNAQYSNITRLYTSWTADRYQKTGCFNVLCPGFVQLSKKITLGLPVRPISVYGGDQYDIFLIVHQDSVTLDWWLMFGEENVGYWPNKIFTHLAGGATTISWGGSVYSPVKEPGPVMGSGHFGEGFNKTAFVNSIQILGNNYKFIDPDQELLNIVVEKPQCYDANFYQRIRSWGQYVYFGGPGNCTF